MLPVVTAEPSPTPPPSPRPPRAGSGHRWRRARWAVLVLGLVVVWVWREPLRRYLAWRGVLANDAPPADLVEQLIEQAPKAAAAVRTAWQTGKIAHRQAAVRAVRRVVPPPGPLPADLETLLRGAALDPDLTTREAALRDLRDRRHPALPGLIARQLRDVDPQVRLLGLQLLKGSDPAAALPLVRPVLEDSDPVVLTTALKLLEAWSGESFGVKLAEVQPLEVLTGAAPEIAPETDPRWERVRAAAARARAWWEQLPPGSRSPWVPPADPRVEPTPLPAPDFELPSLDGATVRLRALRGRVVLLNFWTTWCTACGLEFPALTALRRQQGDDLVVLGVSLDLVPDSHGHRDAHAGEGESDAGGQDPPAHTEAAAARQRVRDKVRRFVQQRGINYPVLLDEHNVAGGRYQAGELPTTVVVDARSYVRRRWVGARSLRVFEALVAEAARPASTSDSGNAGRP